MQAEYVFAGAIGAALWMHIPELMTTAGLLWLLLIAYRLFW